MDCTYPQNDRANRRAAEIGTKVKGELYQTDSLRVLLYVRGYAPQLYTSVPGP